MNRPLLREILREFVVLVVGLLIVAVILVANSAVVAEGVPRWYPKLGPGQTYSDIPDEAWEEKNQETRGVGLNNHMSAGSHHSAFENGVAEGRRRQKKEDAAKAASRQCKCCSRCECCGQCPNDQTKKE